MALLSFYAFQNWGIWRVSLHLLKRTLQISLGTKTHPFTHLRFPLCCHCISSVLCALWSDCGKTAWSSILASAGFHWLWWFGTISICVMHDFQVSLCQRDKMCFVFWQLCIVCVLIYLLGWSPQLVWMKVATVSTSQIGTVVFQGHEIFQAYQICFVPLQVRSFVNFLPLKFLSYLFCIGAFFLLELYLLLLLPTSA